MQIELAEIVEGNSGLQLERITFKDPIRKIERISGDEPGYGKNVRIVRSFLMRPVSITGNSSLVKTEAKLFLMSSLPRKTLSSKRA